MVLLPGIEPESKAYKDLMLDHCTTGAYMVPGVGIEPTSPTCKDGDNPPANRVL